MASLVTCLAFMLSLVPAQALSATPQPDPAPISDRNFTAQYRLYGWHNCNKDEENAILDGLKEKSTILGMDSSFFINWNGAPAIDFFG
jgi:hypothetical protein